MEDDLLSPISRKTTAIVIVIVLAIAGIAGAAAYYSFFNASPGASPKTQLNMWMWTYPPAVAFYKNLTAEFEALHPDVDVVVTDIAYREYETKLSVAFAAGGGPDVFYIGDWGFQSFFEKGVMAPVNYTAMGYSSQADFINNRFWPGSMAPFIVNGTAYCGGFSEYNTISVLYNKDSFDRAGVPYPAENVSLTWDEFADLGKRLTLYGNDGKMTQMGWGFVFDARWGESLMEPLFRQVGGALFDPASNSPTNKTAWLKVAQYVHDVSKFGVYNFSDPAFPTVPNPRTDMSNGRVAMAFVGPWGYRWGLSDNASFRGGVMPFPHFEGYNRSTGLYSVDFYVNKQSDAKKQEWGWKWTEFVTNDTNTYRWWDQAGYLQPRNVPGYKEYLLAQNPWMYVFYEDYALGQFSFKHSKYYQIADQNLKFLQLLMIAGTDPATAVDMAWTWIKAAAVA